MILCESLIDALTFWCAGYRNVTSAYGINGLTKEIIDALAGHNIKRVLIAYDRDAGGETGAEDCSRKAWTPMNMLCRSRPPARALAR